jgi:hypothetical protein
MLQGIGPSNILNSDIKCWKDNLQSSKENKHIEALSVMNHRHQCHKQSRLKIKHEKDKVPITLKHWISNVPKFLQCDENGQAATEQHHYLCLGIDNLPLEAFKETLRSKCLYLSARLLLREQVLVKVDFHSLDK